MSSLPATSAVPVFAAADQEYLLNSAETVSFSVATPRKASRTILRLASVTWGAVSSTVS